MLVEQRRGSVEIGGRATDSDEKTEREERKKKKKRTHRLLQRGAELLCSVAMVTQGPEP